MIIGTPAPFVSAFVEAIDEVIHEHSPNHSMSAVQRTWLAFCVTAVLVTNSICWARVERASLGTYSLAALSWMFRHRTIPWDQLLVASVRRILRHHGLRGGSLVMDDTDNPRSKSAKALAYLYKLRLSHETTTRPALVRTVQSPTPQLHGQLYHGRCPVRHGLLCGSGFGSLRWCAGHHPDTR
jgi:hypothetical protein